MDRTQRPQNTLAPLGPLGSHRVVCFIAWNWLRDDSQRAPRWRRLDAEMAWRWHGSLRGAEVKRKVGPTRLIKHKVWLARRRVDFDTPLKKNFSYPLNLFNCFSKFGFTRLWGRASWGESTKKRFGILAPKAPSPESRGSFVSVLVARSRAG